MTVSALNRTKRATRSCGYEPCPYSLVLLPPDDLYPCHCAVCTPRSQNHPFFEGIDWDNLTGEESPYIPPTLDLPEPKLVSDAILRRHLENLVCALLRSIKY